jgi:hypothetical protein
MGRVRGISNMFDWNLSNLPENPRLLNLGMNGARSEA